MQSGVYQMLDKQGMVIYIGKAKNLKNVFQVILIKYIKTIKPEYWLLIFKILM